METIWASLLAKALEGKDVKDLLSNVGAGGGAPVAGGGGAAAGGAPAEAAAAETKEEKKEEEKEESDDDMVCIVGLESIGLTKGFLFRALVYSTECWLLLCGAFPSASLFFYTHIVTHCMHQPTTKSRKHFHARLINIC